MKERPELFNYFFWVWLCLGIFIASFMHFTNDIALKKKMLPVFIIGSGVIFAGFILVMSGRPWLMGLVIPAVALISFINLKFTKICDSCGKVVYNYYWFSRMEYCSGCGAKLQ